MSMRNATGLRPLLSASAAWLLLGTPALAGRIPSEKAISDLAEFGAIRGISPGGVVTGQGVGAGGFARGLVWDGGSPVELPTLGGQTSSAAAANGSGAVVGEASTAGEASRRAFTYQNGSMTDLGTLGGANSAANAINDAGVVVGSAETAAGHSHAFRHDGSGMTDLGTLGGTSSIARGINAFGQVVGQATLAGGERRAFLYESGSMRDLGTLGGTLSDARAINDAGRVVGQSYTAEGRIRAFLYDPDSDQMSDLGVTNGFTSGLASAISNSGLVVGTLFGRPGRESSLKHAFVWEDGVITDLNTLLPPDSPWVLREALGVSDDGEIVGLGTYGTASRPFLINLRALQAAAVPEPSLLALAGLVAALAVGRKALRRPRG